MGDLVQCITRPRTIPLIGGAVTAILGLDRVFPRLPPNVHHAIGGLVAEAVMGSGLRVPWMNPLSMGQAQVVDLGCTALTGVAGAWIANRPELAGVRNAIPFAK